MLSGVINTNVNALYALNSLSNTTNTTNTLEQELSTGLSINSPADDDDRRATKRGRGRCLPRG